MPTQYSALMGLAEPVQGELAGSWGDAVNKGITEYLDVALAGTQTISGTQTAVTLSLTNGTSSATNIAQAGSGATGSAQFAIINCTGAPVSLLTITVPASSRQYIVINATSTSQSVKIVGVGPTTGVTIVSGEKAHIAWDGSDFVKVASTVITNLTGTLGVANGGTGQTTASAAFNALSPITTTGDLILGNGANSATRLAIGANNYVLTSNGTTASWAAIPAGGTVTSVSWTGGIVSVANGTTTPAFTIAGTSGGIPYFSSASTWATSAALAANALVIGGGAGAAPATTTTGTGVVTALGIAVGSSGAFTTNNAANTFTALQTFSGSTSVAAAKLANAKEVCTVSATAATGTIAYDVTTQSVLYYTSNASANWTVNFRGSSGTSLDTLMSTGESMTVAFLVTQGATAYYNSAVQVDGASVTPKYQGGTAWTAGNASSIDAYVYTIVKTGSATFTVFASQTQFK